MQRVSATVTERSLDPRSVSALADGEVTVTDLVLRARAGCPEAWEALVERFRPLVTALAGRWRLGPADAEDVAQAVWLKLCEGIDDLREPRALPGWLSIVTTNECARVMKAKARTLPLAEGWEEPPTHARWSSGPNPQDREPQVEGIVRQETIRVVREGIAELPERHRRLLLLLVADPPLPYTEIGARLGMPVGSIGPTRARALERLRRTTAMGDWLASETSVAA